MMDLLPKLFLCHRKVLWIKQLKHRDQHQYLQLLKVRMMTTMYSAEKLYLLSHHEYLSVTLENFEILNNSEGERRVFCFIP